MNMHKLGRFNVAYLWLAVTLMSTCVSSGAFAQIPPDGEALNPASALSDKGLVYSNFKYRAPDDLYSDSNIALSVPTKAAESFVAPFTGFITAIKVPLAFIPNAFNYFPCAIEIFQDDQGRPGARIYGGNLYSAVSVVSDDCCTEAYVQSLFIAAGSAPITIGNRYWVSVGAVDSQTPGVWRLNSKMSTGPVAVNNTGEWIISKTLLPAVEIDGTP